MRPQVPQARLVARWWLVHPAQELARKHCRHARCCCRNHSHGVERQRGEGAQVQDARGMSVEGWESSQGYAVSKCEADKSWNSLTGSHLRDTGRGRFASTRLRRRPPAVRDPHRKKQSSEDSMWNYGVFGIQREERLWEEHLYICEEANRQVPPMMSGWLVLWYVC